jgi:ABC-type phosphate/phosphonate transport system substrate-binding protein
MRRGTRWGRGILLGCALALLAGAALGQGDSGVLQIGSSGATTDKKARRKEESSRATLERLIKEETGLDNRLTYLKSWRELARQLVKGEKQLGAFEGYEFAWAQAKYPGLKPLAVAVNVHRYPVACVVVKRESKVSDFSDLQGKSIFLPPGGPHHLRLFVERRCTASRKTVETFFSKVATQDTFEDALDDVVDGVTDAAAVDQTALDAYRRRKPGRATRLRELLRSQSFPPAVVAYHGNVPDEAARRRFLTGLLAAHTKEKGRSTLALFRVTAFEGVPADFDRALARTRRAYPEAPVPAK